MEERSVSFICNQNSAVRIFVWESEYDSLQYGRGRFQSRIMVLLRKTGGFSIQGVSIAGGVFHNIGQLLLAMMIVETIRSGTISRFAHIGLVTGLLIGIVSSEVLKRTAFLKKAE